jgi:hypothetical protein
MDYGKIMTMQHATLAARPIGSGGPSATPLKVIGGMPISGATATGGRLPPSAVEAVAAKEGKPRGRPTKEERKKERRMEIMADIDDLVDDKPTKSKIRIYLLTRIQQLLEERGITTS